jgi:peptidoglycan/xylan/chitin deacetylase (PgdA/CDA1 family)
LLLLAATCTAADLSPEPTSAKAGKIPDKLVVMTFDDSVADHATYVAPQLKKFGFGATFFITEGFNFLTNKTRYLTWEQIKELNDAGFEIGNHPRNHQSVQTQSPDQIAADVAQISFAFASTPDGPVGSAEAPRCIPRLVPGHGDHC